MTSRTIFRNTTIAAIAALLVIGVIGTVDAFAAAYPPGLGGTGTSAAPQPGQILIGNASGTYGVAYLQSAGCITVATSSGGITLSCPVAPATTTINGVQASGFRLVGDGATLTSTVSGATTTFFVPANTFYPYSSNPSGYTSTTASGTPGQIGIFSGASSITSYPDFYCDTTNKICYFNYANVATGGLGVGMSSLPTGIDFGVNGASSFSGNVGVGTTTPQATIHAYGSNATIRSESTGVTNAFLDAKADGAAQGAVRFGYNGNTIWSVGVNSAVPTTLLFGGSFNLATATDYMAITNSGNVGIGTTAPSQVLTVIGQNNFNNSQIFIENTSTDATVKSSRILGGTYTNANQPLFLIGSQGGASVNQLYIGGFPGGSSMTAATGISFLTATSTNTTGGTTAMTINGSGNVGVGNTNTPALLTVGALASTTGDPTNKGTIQIQSNGSGGLTNGGGLEFKGSSAGGGFGWNIATPDLGASTVPLVISYRTNSASWTNAVTIGAGGAIGAGFVGIGTTAPSSTLHVAATASSTIRIGTASNTSNPGCVEMYDSVNSSTLMYLYFSNGSIIGTSTKPAFCQ